MLTVTFSNKLLHVWFSCGLFRYLFSYFLHTYFLHILVIFSTYYLQLKRHLKLGPELVLEPLQFHGSGSATLLCTFFCNGGYKCVVPHRYRYGI
jgi:hypothetical protein